MNDLVSVIITTYKGEENICRAVESVLGQTYKSIEIIVVDDNGKEHKIVKQGFGSQAINGNQSVQSVNGYKGAQS